MKSWVVWLSIKVAVSSVPSTVIFIFMLWLFSGAISVSSATVGVAVVGVTGSVVGDTVVGDEVIADVTGVGSEAVEVDAGAQAVMKTAARVNTMMRLLGFAIYH